jgi:two-component system nitrogen regulation sensor histidine kinase NtrY
MGNTSNHRHPEILWEGLCRFFPNRLQGRGGSAGGDALCSRIFCEPPSCHFKGLQEYRQLKMLKNPIKASHMITLSIVTLLIIFTSVWFGFYISKEVTVPINELAEATNRIASGDYNFFIDLETKDEMGLLVNSFNRMTRDLKTGKNRLESANRELVSSNLELEQRRLYMEIVLANVAAGVVSADARGRILTINKSAERMLNIRAERIIGKNYKEILSHENKKIVDTFIRNEGLLRKGFMNKQIRMTAGNRQLTLLVSLNVLQDDRGGYRGAGGRFRGFNRDRKSPADGRLARGGQAYRP